MALENKNRSTADLGVPLMRAYSTVKVCKLCDTVRMLGSHEKVE